MHEVRPQTARWDRKPHVKPDGQLINDAERLSNTAWLAWDVTIPLNLSQKQAVNLNPNYYGPILFLIWLPDKKGSNFEALAFKWEFTPRLEGWNFDSCHSHYSSCQWQGWKPQKLTAGKSSQFGWGQMDSSSRCVSETTGWWSQN